MVGSLVQRRREALGLTQTELAERAGLRQTYISQVERGEIRLPRDHNLDAIGGVLDITRAQFYREAGIFDDVRSAQSDDEPTAERRAYLAEAARALPRAYLVMLSRLQGMPDLTDPMNVANAVLYVEAKPEERHQAMLARRREVLPLPRYLRGCLRLYAAWSSNAEVLFEDAEDLGAGV